MTIVEALRAMVNMLQPFKREERERVCLAALIVLEPVVPTRQPTVAAVTRRAVTCSKCGRAGHNRRSHHEHGGSLNEPL